MRVKSAMFMGLLFCGCNGSGAFDPVQPEDFRAGYIHASCDVSERCTDRTYEECVEAFENTNAGHVKDCYSATLAQACIDAFEQFDCEGSSPALVPECSEYTWWAPCGSSY